MLRFAGKRYCPAPRPSARNIQLKFERCFKGRDESNLNAEADRARYRWLSTKVPEKSAYPTLRQQSVTFPVGIVITMRKTAMALSKTFSARLRLTPEFKNMIS